VTALALAGVVLLSAAWGAAEARAIGGVRRSAAAEDTASTMIREAARTGTLSGLRWPRFPYYRDELTGLYSGTS